VKFYQAFPLAAEFVRRNKMRASLTALGIVIGIASVVALVSSGQAAQRSVVGQINSLGPDLVFVLPFPPVRVRRLQGPPPIARAGSVGSLTLADANAIRDSVPGLNGVAPELHANVPVTSGDIRLQARVLGTTADYETIRNAQLREGRFFSSREEGLGQNLAVIGPDIASQLGPAGVPGGEITVGRRPFRIIGVLAPRGIMGGINLDEMVIVPAPAAKSLLVGDDRVVVISVSVKGGGSTPQGKAAIERMTALLRSRHNIQPGGTDDFNITTQADILETAQSITTIMTVLLGAIASISLLVGGIGVMNIMLVSVTERTREIGLRKAVGAKRRDILLQFLSESVGLTLVGGIFGVVLGSAAAVAIVRSMDLQGGASPAAIVMAFLVSAAVGVFFGVYPAHKASKLEPIEALRYE
jgi:putative ABC transport system permease protein